MQFNFSDHSRQQDEDACRERMEKALKVYRDDGTPENRDVYMRTLKDFAALVIDRRASTIERELRRDPWVSSARAVTDPYQ